MIKLVAIEDGGFDANLGIALENVTLTNGEMTVLGERVAWDTLDDEEMEEAFEEWTDFATNGVEGFTIL